MKKTWNEVGNQLEEMVGKKFENRLSYCDYKVESEIEHAFKGYEYENETEVVISFWKNCVIAKIGSKSNNAPLAVISFKNDFVTKVYLEEELFEEYDNEKTWEEVINNIKLFEKASISEMGTDVKEHINKMIRSAFYGYSYDNYDGVIINWYNDHATAYIGNEKAPIVVINFDITELKIKDVYSPDEK